LRYVTYRLARIVQGCTIITVQLPHSPGGIALDRRPRRLLVHMSEEVSKRCLDTLDAGVTLAAESCGRHGCWRSDLTWSAEEDEV
jgi:hypothetical protein